MFPNARDLEIPKFFRKNLVPKKRERECRPLSKAVFPNKEAETIDEDSFYFYSLNDVLGKFALSYFTEHCLCICKKILCLNGEVEAKF